jgi:hypothetical protein
MSAAVRRYRRASALVDELGRGNSRAVVRGVPGFVAYYLVRVEPPVLMPVMGSRTCHSL